MHRLTVLPGGLRVWLNERERGQGLTEYALILVAVAVAVAISVYALGPKVASMFSNAATKFPT